MDHLANPQPQDRAKDLKAGKRRTRAGTAVSG